MNRVLLAAILIVNLVTPAMAQTEISARRAYILCQQEDPQCANIIHGAYESIIANPTTREYSSGLVLNCSQFVKNLDNPSLTPKLTVDIVYVRFMELMRMGQISDPYVNDPDGVFRGHQIHVSVRYGLITAITTLGNNCSLPDSFYKQQEAGRQAQWKRDECMQAHPNSSLPRYSPAYDHSCDYLKH